MSSRAAILALLIAAIGIGTALIQRGPTASELIAEARAAFNAQDYRSAQRAALRVLDESPHSAEALLLAAGATAQLGDAAAAVTLYDRLPAGPDERVNNGHAIAAHLTFFQLHRAADAERRFRAVLGRDPRHPTAVAGLADLLGFAGRKREAEGLLIELTRQDRISVNQLTLLGSESGGHREAGLLEQCLEAVPDDPNALLGLSWQAEQDGHLIESERLAREAVAAAPDLLEARISVARLLWKQARGEELAAWCGEFPAEADDHPQAWRLRGDCAAEQGDSAGAARCYWESVRRDPNSRVALHGLLESMRVVEYAAPLRPFEQRVKQLQALEESESFLFESQHSSLEPIRAVAEQMEVLGRIWESWAWARFAQQVKPGDLWSQQHCARLQPILDRNPPLTLATANPAEQVDLSTLPLPTGPSAIPEPAVVKLEHPTTVVRFRDDAAAAGLNFQYVNGGDPETPGQFMYEFSGGGVGVIDYDRDGWPDLHWTQGCRWPPDAERFDSMDRLFRNRADGSFQEVTPVTGISENGYSQGVGVGDFDADGFPDLYVGNIGKNRLYRNNGDGTFVDHSAAVHGDAGSWTTSCLLADLSGDGLPDLYDANYLSGSDVFERMCQHKDGEPRMCAPFDFAAAADQFHLNRGDGTFVESSHDSGFDAPNGKGLGLAAADFDGTGRLSLFVANDLVPNFFFRNVTRPGEDARFLEEGLASGTAFDHAGQAQGCMGIAVGDLNDDGRLDLFVTNFAQEYNAYYVQAEDGAFRDEIRRSGIAAATLPVLGFGTQAMDADLDGRLDLLVTNGQVDDHRAYGRAYHMSPQYFHNVGGGQFVEKPAAELGDFFAGQYLGRGMARLDWNRDGREDAAISHLDSPAALLTNLSEGEGGHLTLQLIGTHSDRDACGTTVTVTTSEGRTIVRQVTAGDGYQASNERVLVIGLGRFMADRIDIRWPSGGVQTFEGVGRNRDFIAVEGRSRLWAMTTDRLQSPHLACANRSELTVQVAGAR